MNKNVKKVFEIKATEQQMGIIEDLLCHIEYLGNIGASRNILVRVDGDGIARIKVDFEGKKIKSYNINQNLHKNYRGYDFSPNVGVYDLE